jgi:hypothetical protein
MIAGARSAVAMENALFYRIAQKQPDLPDPAAPPANAWLDASRGLRTVALHANRLQSAIEKNTAYLESLEAKRKAARPQTQEEAILLTELAEANDQTYNPEPDFPSRGTAAEFVLFSARNQAPDRPRRPPLGCQDPLRGGCAGRASGRSGAGGSLRSSRNGGNDPSSPKCVRWLAPQFLKTGYSPARQPGKPGSVPARGTKAGRRQALAPYYFRASDFG